MKMKAKVKATGQIIDVFWLGMDMQTRQNMYCSSDHKSYTGDELAMPSTKEIWQSENT